MSSSGNVWAVNRIQHICNIVIHKSPIYGLSRIFKRSQRDNQFHNAERLTAFQKVYYTPGLLFWSVFIAKQEYKYD